MNTNIMCRCTTDGGKHGLQNVQSVLIPEGLYYLECGCIYKYIEEKDIFKLLRPYHQKCATCGNPIGQEMVLTIGAEVWCMECAPGKKGILKEYRHDLVPVFITGYEVRWKKINDTKKHERDIINDNEGM